MPDNAARQVRLSPLLPAGLRIASAVINRPANPDAIPVSGVVQRPVAEQFHLNTLTAAGLGNGMAFSTVASGAKRR